MFGIGMSEMLIILAVALLVFGPAKLPEIAKSIAKGLKELRRAGDDLRSSVNFDLDDDKPNRRPLPRATPPVETTNAPPTPPATSTSPTEPAASPGSELATGAPADEPWPKPARDTTARGDVIDEPVAQGDGSASVDESKVH
jgi:TatA/E family protein of Tat protein translocase